VSIASENDSRIAPRTTLATLFAGISITCENVARIIARTVLDVGRERSSRTSLATSHAVPSRPAANVRHQRAALLRGLSPIV